MAHHGTTTSVDNISLQEIIFSCCVCQATLSEVYASKDSAVGLHQEAGQRGSPITRLWIAECSHVFCGKHLDGGGVPFFPDQQEAPRAACPVCSEQKEDKTAKELFGLRGFADGEYDNATLAEWVQCPPAALDATSDALRFQYMSLSRYGIYATQRLKQAAREITEAKEHCFEELKQRQQAQAEAVTLRARVGELEKDEARLQQWEERKPEIEHYLSKYDEMTQEIHILRQELERHGIPYFRRSYTYDKEHTAPKPNEAALLNKVQTPSVRKHSSVVNAPMSWTEPSPGAIQPPPPMPGLRKRPLQVPQAHPDEPRTRRIRVDDSLAMPPPALQPTPYANALRREPHSEGLNPRSDLYDSHSVPLISRPFDGDHQNEPGLVGQRRIIQDLQEAPNVVDSTPQRHAGLPGRTARNGDFRIRSVGRSSSVRMPARAHIDHASGLAGTDVTMANSDNSYGNPARSVRREALALHETNYSSAFARPYALPNTLPPPTTPAMRRIATDTPALTSPFFRSLSSRTFQPQVSQSSVRHSSLQTDEPLLSRSTPYMSAREMYANDTNAMFSNQGYLRHRQPAFDTLPDTPRNPHGLFERPDRPQLPVVYEAPEPNTHRTRITLTPSQQAGRGPEGDLSTLARIRGLRGATAHGPSRQQHLEPHDRRGYSRMARQSVRR